jgi:F-type H+-transporting ATPase subunit gamma
MIGSLKQIKNRLRSVENTAKITHAMEMVSVSKLRSSELFLAHNRVYCKVFADAVNSVINRTAGLTHPYLDLKADLSRPVLILVTSDNGLCSTYNQEIIRLSEEFLKKFPGKAARIMAVGKKGFDYFSKKGYAHAGCFFGLQAKYRPEVIEDVFRRAHEIFTGEAVPVYIAYTGFHSALNYRTQVERLLPVERAREPFLNYLFEPSDTSVLESVLPDLIRAKIRLSVLESFSAEHSSRAIAMKSATDNAKDLRKYLILTRNKMRQAAITKEIIEVISSAEALKG